MGSCFTGWDPEKHDEKDHKIKESLYFYGVVNDNEGTAMEDVAVMVFACYTDGIEKPLGYTFTDGTGKYLISIPKLPDYNNLAGFKARAGKSSKPEFYHPIICEDKPCRQLKRDFVQDIYPNDQYEPGREDTLDKETDSVPAKKCGEAVININEAGESEYHGKPEFKMTLTDEYNGSWREKDLVVTSRRIDLNPSKEVIIENDQLPNEVTTCRLQEENRADLLLPEDKLKEYTGNMLDRPQAVLNAPVVESKDIIKKNEALLNRKKGLTSIATFLIIFGLLSTCRWQKG